MIYRIHKLLNLLDEYSRVCMAVYVCERYCR